MQQLELRTMPRLVFLVRRFRAQVARQRQQDDATLASLLRALKRGGPDAELLCRLIDHRVTHASVTMGQASGSRDMETDL
jgi:hypothetical protein